MMRREHELGVNPLADPPPLPGPPEVLQPLLPPLIPAPDWRAEEQARAREEAAEKELEPEPDRYPARPKPKEKRTPNLDDVKAWRNAP
jgi:hypothetical protein